MIAVNSKYLLSKTIGLPLERGNMAYSWNGLWKVNIIKEQAYSWKMGNIQKVKQVKSYSCHCWHRECLYKLYEKILHLVRSFNAYNTLILPLLIWLRHASIRIMKEAGTVIVSFVSSSITSFLSVNWNTNSHGLYVFTEPACGKMSS